MKFVIVNSVVVSVLRWINRPFLPRRNATSVVVVGYSIAKTMHGSWDFSHSLFESVIGEVVPPQWGEASIYSISGNRGWK